MTKQSNPSDPPHQSALIKIIRQLATTNIWFSEHAFDERRGQRNISVDDALAVLRIGDISGKIVPGKNPGEWKCLVIGPVIWASREIGVATVIVRKNELIITTVEWMDP